jgi:HlyD family secretion protein
MKKSFILACLLMWMWTMLSGCAKKYQASEGLFVSGRIDGDTLDISSRREGRILEINVREGDHVEAGQVLARISSPQDKAQVEVQKANVVNALRKLQEAEGAAPARVASAQADLAAKKAELVRWEVELEQAEQDAKRYAPLVKTGAVSAQIADQQSTRAKIARASTESSRRAVAAAEAELNQAKAQLQQIATARADLESNRAELKRFEANVGDLTISAPVAGTILTRSAEPGRVIAPGQTILTMVDLQKLYLRGFIPEGEIGKVKVGQQAKVYLDSNPNQALEAELIRIDPQVMFTPENTYFKDDRVKQVMGVKLGLKNGFGYAKPGMPADGFIQIGSQ